MRTRSKLLATAAAVLLVAVPLSGSAGASLASRPSAHSKGAATKPATLAQVKKLVAASVKIKKLTSKMATELKTATSDNASHVYGIPASCNTPTACVYGDTSATKSIVLFGDSHARMWLPAVIPSAISHGVKLILIGQDGCPIVSIVWTSGPFVACNAVRTNDIAAINAIEPPPISIVLSEKTSYGFPSAEWQTGFAATLSALEPSGAKLAVIGDIQVLGKNPVQCLAAFPSGVQKCTQPNPDKGKYFVGQEKAEKAATLAAKGLYVDPTPWLCTATKCSPVIGTYIAYWDSYHVSVTYSKYLNGVMGSALAKDL